MPRALVNSQVWYAESPELFSGEADSDKIIRKHAAQPIEAQNRARSSETSSSRRRGTHLADDGTVAIESPVVAPCHVDIASRIDGGGCEVGELGRSRERWERTSRKGGTEWKR